MDVLSLKIKNVKNIQTAEVELPFENGVYSFVGENGCGKSTLMLCLAQLLSKRQFEKFRNGDVGSSSSVEYFVENKRQICRWNSLGRFDVTGDDIRYNGMYEGSLFYGTRFEDSTNIEQMIVEGKITEDKIVNDDKQVQEQLSFILHGDLDHYQGLLRLKNKQVALDLKIKNRPYFNRVNTYLLSQYRMSSGECLLVSLLHFLYNSIERRSLPANQKVLVLIDELELALHPIAINRLMDYLQKLAHEHSNLIVYLSSHSPEVIRKMKPSCLYRVNNDNGIVSLESNCYPSYLIRDLYCNISPDFLLLVEDDLAMKFLNRLLTKNNLRKSKLIHIVPVGGWRNVLDLHSELFCKKVLGTNTKIISILDGDVEGKLSKSQKQLPHCFLPIMSIEKFLYSVIKENSNPKLRKVVNDKYFIVKSLNEIVAEFNARTRNGHKDDNKNFYTQLISELSKIGTKEDVFVDGLCDDIEENIDMSNFSDNLSSLLE